MEALNASISRSKNQRNSSRPGAIPRKPNSQVSSCSTRMNQRTFSNFWAIENFSVQLELHTPGEFMLAPKFGDTDYEFVMKLFPNGKDEETSHYLSLFLLINKCPNPRLRFRVSFTVETADGPRTCHLNKNLVTINRSGIVTASKFFSLEVLKTGPDIYIPKDVLTIGCELTIFGESLAWTTNHFHPYSAKSLAISSSGSASSPSYRIRKANGNGDDVVIDNDDKDEMEDGFAELLSTGDFSDFTIVGSCGREFPVHMCILSARSEYFKALLRNQSTKEFTEKRVVFEDISGDVLEPIIRHIYAISPNTDRFEHVDVDQLSSELVGAVDRLMISTMRTEIAEMLRVNVTAENVVARLSMASDLRLDEVYQNLLEYFASHKIECMRMPIWNELRAAKPVLTIKILEDAILAFEETMGPVNTRPMVDRITIN